MKQVAIIGAGVSGLTVAHMLAKKGYSTTIFEKESQPGGLIRCKRISGSLFHICGGHIFNSKRQDVLEWFWSIFDRDVEFSKANRNSVVFMENGLKVPYPIENHIYLFDEKTQKEFIDDLIKISQKAKSSPQNFGDFLRQRFGETLYRLYFKPYNEKIWRKDLNNVPLSWLEGKLPMPTVTEMIYNNINHVEEKAFVHSTFWYEKKNGSQFLADKLANGLNIKYNTPINSIKYIDNKWNINEMIFDYVIFCGNIKDLPTFVTGLNLQKYKEDIEKLEYHGTTSVFCKIDKNPYSWIYQPSKLHESHRIICTGNFAESNNAEGMMTATIEFTDYINEEDIKENLKKMPLKPQYITHCYNKYTYPIQNNDTRVVIQNLKSYMKQFNFFFTGRFADWEYYNMDIAMGAAMDLCKTL